jgi:hypothetical protein
MFDIPDCNPFNTSRPASSCNTQKVSSFPSTYFLIPLENQNLEEIQKDE